MQFVDSGGQPGEPVAPGVVDYQLARRRVLRRFRAGELQRNDVCDAQRELMRVAHECSETVRRRCPICDVPGLRIVRFVFGPRLPPGGRCVVPGQELTKLAQRSGEHRCYVVEVCVSCRWNHLQRVAVLSPNTRL